MHITKAACIRLNPNTSVKPRTTTRERGYEDRLGELDGPAAVVEAVEKAGESAEAVRADNQHRGYLDLRAHPNADRRRGGGDDNEQGDEEGGRVCQREASLQLVDEEAGDGKSEE